MRESDSKIARPLASGVPLPTNDVLPDCGTTGVPVSYASFITAETSSVDPGRTTATTLP